MIRPASFATTRTSRLWRPQKEHTTSLKWFGSCTTPMVDRSAQPAYTSPSRTRDYFLLSIYAFASTRSSSTATSAANGARSWRRRRSRTTCRALSAMFKYARRRRRMETNPVELLEPLHVPRPETPVLREEEVAAVLNA